MKPHKLLGVSILLLGASILAPFAMVLGSMEAEAGVFRPRGPRQTVAQCNKSYSSQTRACQQQSYNEIYAGSYFSNCMRHVTNDLNVCTDRAGRSAGGSAALRTPKGAPVPKAEQLTRKVMKQSPSLSDRQGVSSPDVRSLITATPRPNPAGIPSATEFRACQRAAGTVDAVARHFRSSGPCTQEPSDAPCEAARGATLSGCRPHPR